MAFRRSAVIAAGLGALLAVLPIGIAWLPVTGMAGRTTVLYSYVGAGIEFVVGIVLVAGIGYWVGKRIDLETQYRPLLTAFGGGGAAGYAGVGGVLVIGELTTGSGSGVLLVSVVGSIVAVGIQFAVSGFAGAALAHVTSDNDMNDTATSTPSPANHPS